MVRLVQSVLRHRVLKGRRGPTRAYAGSGKVDEIAAPPPS